MDKRDFFLRPMVKIKFPFHGNCMVGQLQRAKLNTHTHTIYKEHVWRVSFLGGTMLAV